MLAPAALAPRGDGRPAATTDGVPTARPVVQVREAPRPTPPEASPTAPEARPSARQSPQVRRMIAKLEREREMPLRYDQPQEGQDFFVLKRAPEGSSSVPSERYAAALEHMRRMPRYSTRTRQSSPSIEDALGAGPPDLPPPPAPPPPDALSTWTSLGPGNIGGRTRRILIDPSTPATMYAAGIAGGVWKTTNSGTSWTPLEELMANLAVSSLVMDPGNSSILYAGTGEGFFNIDAVRGAGIFKSTDAGDTWTQLANTNNSNFHYVNDLVVSPNNSLRVYAATRNGVWRSTNGGTNWSQVLTTAVTAGCLDLAIRTDQ